MKLRDARLLAELSIREAWDGYNVETDSIEIYSWDDPPLETMKRNKAVGFRVAEVSFVRRAPNSVGGSSYMQTDAPIGLAVCAATERAVISLVEEWEPEEQHEEIWRLCHLICEDAERAAAIADKIIPEGRDQDVAKSV